MFTILLGKTASGKDTILNKLVSDHGYKKMVTYTTRPIRPGEIQGITYHFMSQDEFFDKIDNSFFLEHKVYHTEVGDWHYGSAKEDFEKADDHTIVILTPDGYRDFLQACPNKPHISIYINSNIETIKKRLIKRGDNHDEVNRRVLHDNEDFKNTYQLVDRIVYNNEGYDLEDVVNKVLRFIGGDKND